jgi:hypothetical protein
MSAATELSSTEAALRLGVTEGTLRNWRSAKPRIGPRPTYKGKRGAGKKPRVVYLLADIEKYERELRRQA